MKYIVKSLAYILGRFVFNLKYMTGTSKKYGVKMKFRTPDGGGRVIYKKGAYEENLSDFLLKTLELNQDDIAIDVGGNIGWYAVLLGKNFPASRGFSFEPEPDNFHCLTQNLNKNGVDNFTAVQKGVSNVSETKTLYLYKKSNIGRHSMLSINDGPTMDVETITLDEFIVQNDCKFEDVKFMKIDIEGFEFFAFKGADKLLDTLPMILAEFSPGYMRKGGVEPKELLDYLRNKNYVPHSLLDGKLNQVEDKKLLERDNNINLIWIKS